MASTCFRAAARMASAARRSAAAPHSASSAARAAAAAAARRAPCFSRMPVELGCCTGMSLFPLHSAVAAARLTSRLSTASRTCSALSQEMGQFVRR
ncbi:protein NUCLEAR FUSION DEFECTIVE 6, mitochondrial-like isoform X2 [Phragmites australis]|uniref:protein NUCLEAR FUSION DEFECTIVE 6, mitochondrial-like isoform X2 n=1 Tax=Phragmites australis TaxID=29695 RepID=UPI002D797332|nr:protein NUCLEAR FUSION DEFECTIVE 6, mitochondrial-like isoform X2 [Phragmites australis]